ncbi:MAG: hypothetical protein RLO52_28110 [Sandaracinaceae bacterium]
MTDALIRGWRTRAERAASWAPGADPEPVLEALAMSVALELTGALAAVPSAERDALRKTGQRALLNVGGRDLDEDELEALRMSAAIARDGLRALSGRPLPREEAPRRDARPTLPVSDLRRLIEGELDGFAAGALAMRARRSDVALREVRAMLSLAAGHSQRASGATGRTLSLAAAEAARVLDPAAGRTVGALDDIGAEAVLFEGPVDPDIDRRLAVYAEDAAPLRLVGEGLTTEDVREGYWIGLVADGVETLEAVLHVGEVTHAWTLDLCLASSTGPE